MYEEPGRRESLERETELNAQTIPACASFVKLLGHEIKSRDESFSLARAFILIRFCVCLCL